MAITKRYYKNKIFYQAEYFSRGVRIISKSFSKKKDALLWIEQMKEHPYTPSHIEITLKNCMNQFFADAKTRLTPSTFNTYSCQARYLYSSSLASLKMSEVKSILIVQWLSWLKAKSTANNPRRKNFLAELKLLSTILNWYKNYINEDFNIPITKKHKKMCIYKKITPRPLNYFIKPSDSRKWISWLKRNKPPVYWRLALFMLSTGVRVGEACGLKWSDIDFEQNTARLTQKVRWDFSTRSPYLENSFKTPSQRLLMIPRPLIKVLRAMKKKSNTSLVFTTSKNNILKYTTIQTAFNQGFISLELPWRSTHICRHTFATIALMSTKNLSAVQASLGHSEPKTTQKYAKIIALLNSRLGEKTFSALFKNSNFS